MLTCMIEIVDGTDILGKDLRGYCRRLYNALQLGDPNMWVILV